MPFSMAHMRKSGAEAGAILMQAVLGLGLMLVMAPIVLNQIQKYNETARREEAIAQLQLLRKAVTSFVSFDRMTVGGGCNSWTTAAMANALADYGGKAVFGDVSPSSYNATNGKYSNALGLTYFFATYKDLTCDGSLDESIRTSCTIEAVAGAYFVTPLDDSETILNGIGQYLFDKGCVKSGTDCLSNYEVGLSSNLGCVPDNAVVMFVTDAFYMSDYMHTDRNPMDSKGLMNTMLTDLNMDDNAITGTKDMDGRKIEVTTNFGATLLSGTELTLGPGPVGIPGIFSIAGPLDSSGAGDPGKVLEGGAGSFKIYPFTLEVTDARVNNLGVAQICMGPYEQMDSTCQGAAGMGTGVGDLYMNQLNDYNTNTASGILSSNRIAVSGILRFPMGWGLVAYKILADRWISESPSSSNYLPNIKFDQSDSTVSNSIYSGTWDATYGYNKPGNTESKDDYASITPAGVSEVKDIVWGGTKSLACEVCKIKSGLDCALEKLDRRLIELDNCKLANPNATSCTVITTGTGSGASCSASKVYPASCTAKGVTCS